MGNWEIGKLGNWEIRNLGYRGGVNERACHVCRRPWRSNEISAHCRSRVSLGDAISGKLEIWDWGKLEHKSERVTCGTNLIVVLRS